LRRNNEKLLIFSLSVMLILSLSTACKEKSQRSPGHPPPAPQAQEQPKAEKVEQPVVKEPDFE